jgi:hypothetical protein
MRDKQYNFRLLTAAGLINFILFTVIIWFTHPIYDTNEDVYILYQLSGGFGLPPTELLHYNYGFPPFLGLALKNLFLITDKINWYTVFLFLAHYIACVNITFQIFQKSTRAIAGLVYLTFFIVFESQLLLNINFTNTSLVLGLSGIVLLITYRSGNSLLQLTIAGLLILAASCFRIHVLIPLVGISLPFIISPWHRQRLIPVIYTLVITIGAVLLVNQSHRAYYISHISSWEKEETHRQKIYSFYNNRTLHEPLPDEKWYTEYSLIQNGIPIDTSFLTDQKLTRILIDLKKKRTTDKPAIQSTKNWFLINNRIFFCTLLILVLLSGLDRKHISLLAISSGIMVGELAFLRFNYKMPDYLIISGLYLLGLSVFLSSKKQLSQKYFYIYASLLIAMILWGTVRIYKNNQRNIREIASFKVACKEITNSPQNLFIIAGDSFPFQKFYVFDLPRQFRLPNFINSEHLMNNIYLPVLSRFGSTDLQSIPYNKHIFFRGKQLDALENYFKLTSKKNVITVIDSSQSSLEKVYRIVFDEPGNKDACQLP